MISPDHARVMAAYNRWQNDSLFGAADGLWYGETRLAAVHDSEDRVAASQKRLRDPRADRLV